MMGAFGSNVCNYCDGQYNDDESHECDTDSMRRVIGRLADKVDELADGTVARDLIIKAFDAALKEATEIIEECQVQWGCECPYCDRNYGKGFDEHATEDNGGRFNCRIGSFLRGEKEDSTP